jgi:hypothetical protein
VESGDIDPVTEHERERPGRWPRLEETESVQLIVDQTSEPGLKPKVLKRCDVSLIGSSNYSLA